MTTAVTARVSDYPRFPEQVPDTVVRDGRYELRFARDPGELDALLRLRFEVFNLELGEGLNESFATRRDLDAFDPVCHHLIVVAHETNTIVGTYRLQTGAMAAAHRGFYSANEFTLGDLPSPVIRDSVELGRACVAREHRNTQVLFLLWRGLATYVRFNANRYLFGCCSLTSQDPIEARAVMAYLEKKGHVHPRLAVQPVESCRCYEEGTPVDRSFRARIPRLFRTYLRHGAKVCGPPAIDREFKTIDYLVIFDVETMNEKQIRTFFG